MKTPFDPTDPLLQSLADEAADLPLKAAGEARKTRALRMQVRRQIALTITVLFCGVCAWQVFPQRDTGQKSIAIQLPPDAPVAIPAQPAPSSPQPGAHLVTRTERFPVQPAPPSPQPRESLIALTEEQARNEPVSLPDGLNKEQENVVKAARGLPLLLVRDSTGKVARIHVIER